MRGVHRLKFGGGRFDVGEFFRVGEIAELGVVQELEPFGPRRLLLLLLLLNKSRLLDFFRVVGHPLAWGKQGGKDVSTRLQAVPLVVAPVHDSRLGAGFKMGGELVVDERPILTVRPSSRISQGGDEEFSFAVPVWR